MLPNFLVIGAEKGGTTWLDLQLRQHHDIFLPETKEVHFFNRFGSNLDECDNFTNRGLSWYEKFFSSWAGQKAVGEVTPMYLCDNAAPQRIHDTLPDVKVICILRNPISRAQSHYWMAATKSHTRLSLEEIVETDDDRIIKRGLYSTQLKRYLDLFPVDRILVLYFEDVFSAPHAALSQVFQFLDVENIKREDADVKEKANASKKIRFSFIYNKGVWIAQIMRRWSLTGHVMSFLKRSGVTQVVRRLNETDFEYPEMTEETRKRLRYRYEDDVAQVAELVGQHPQNWVDFPSPESSGH